MRLLTIVLLLGNLVSLAAANDKVSIVGVDAVEPGIYVSSPGLKLSQITTNIPAALGTMFGFKYTINGTPSRAPVTLTVITKRPPFKNEPSRKKEIVEKDRLPGTIGAPHWACFSFDEEWELVPGKWTWEIWHNQRKLCEQSFNIVVDREKER